MSFAWRRDQNMSLDRPTEEEIIAHIRYSDPASHLQGHWHEWRDEMLEGRDSFLGSIPRHPSLPLLSTDRRLDFLQDPPSWTPLITGLSGSRDLRSGRAMRQCQDLLLCIAPFVEKKEVEPTYFLGIEMASGKVPRWGSSRSLLRNGLAGYHPGYAEWAWYVLRTERETLGIACCIRRAIILSLFSYSMNSEVLRAALEYWCPLTNTFYLEDEEISLSLWDMKQIGGLPIFGIPYDEYVPEEKVLFGEISYGRPRCSSTLRLLFSVYYSILREKGRVSIDSWILAFFHSTSLKTSFPSPRDPFGIGSENIEVQDYDIPDIPPCAAFAVDRRSFLAAFLVCWLCYFVVPIGSRSSIRPEVFVMADQMANGVRVSLATAALANLYRSLRAACFDGISKTSSVLIPLHYLAGWLNLQFRGLYTPIVSERLREKLPFLIEIAGAHATQLGPIAARLLFRKNSASPCARNLFPNRRDLPRELKDYTDDGLGHNIHKKYISFEFLISIRTGWLPFRSRNEISFEVYHRYRCAR